MEATVLDSLCERMDDAKTRSLQNRLPHKFFSTVISEFASDSSFAWLTADKIKNHYNRAWKSQHGAVIIDQTVPVSTQEEDSNLNMEMTTTAADGSTVSADPPQRNK